MVKWHHAKSNDLGIARSIRAGGAMKRPKNRQEKIDAFVADIVKVCKRHGFCLGHEDHHGAFTVEKLDREGLGWLCNAIDCTADPPASPKASETFCGLMFHVRDGRALRRAVVKGRDSDGQDRHIVDVEGVGQVSYHRDTLALIKASLSGLGWGAPVPGGADRRAK